MSGSGTNSPCPAGRLHWVLSMVVVCDLACGGTLGGWHDHRIRQADGRGGWIIRPALRQILRHPDADYTMPFGLVRMDNGEIILLCSREKRLPDGTRIVEPIVAFSRDDGTTWSEFAAVPGTRGRPQFLEWLGEGRLSFVTEVFEGGTSKRVFSHDYGRTWPEQIDHPPTDNGNRFRLEGNSWIDRDEHSEAKAILEIGWYYAPGKSHPKDDATGVFRRSLDGGKTWTDEVAPPQWKFTVKHNGKKWLRGVSEGAIVRAANGDLVAALRTDMPPKYFDGPHDDSLEGTAVSISTDDGKTWSDLNFLFDAGRHHANLQRLPNGDLVCTLIVRDDIRNGKLVSLRRGCDALVSHDNGRTWNLDRRYELDGTDFIRDDGYWVDGRCGHLSSVVLPDGSILTVYGKYDVGAVLIKWKPDAHPTDPAPKIAVGVGPDANELERFAAEELAGYLERLFSIRTRPEVSPDSTADVLFLVGTPQTNPLISRISGPNGWPSVSDQGIVLKRAEVDGKPVLMIGGGSPSATLWAVYDLVQRWGVRYLLHGDVFPADTPVFALPDQDLVIEPVFRVRQWRTVNDFACGPESWGLEEHKRMIDQLAKLKFNRIFVSIWPYQPFLDIEVDGIRRKTAYLWFNFHYPITDDMPGRHLFGTASEFWNPDFPLTSDFRELYPAGSQLIRGIFQHARKRGMECVLTAHLSEFPAEFAPLLPDSEKVEQLGAMSIVPGPETGPDDPALLRLAATVLRTTLQTYLHLDYLTLGMPEHRQWTDHFEKAWKRLDEKYGLEPRFSLSEILAAAEGRTGYPGGAERAVREVKGDLVLLSFYDRVLTGTAAVLSGTDSHVKIILSNVAEELLPVLPSVLPPGSEILNFVDYTPSRILERRQVLERIGSPTLPTSLIYTLHDDNVGLMPQLSTGSLSELNRELYRLGWAGFSTRYWLLGDQDPCVSYLSKAAWNGKLSPEAVYRDLITNLSGGETTEEMLRLFHEVEAATVKLEWSGLGFGFPVPGMLMKHWTPEPLTEELVAVRDHYAAALAAAEEARKESPRGKEYIDYWIGRLKFGVGYLDAVAALRKAARSAGEGRKDEATANLENALSFLRSALESYASVAVDQSDRGAVAVMAEYAYRPLRDKLYEWTERVRQKEK